MKTSIVLVAAFLAAGSTLAFAQSSGGGASGGATSGTAGTSGTGTAGSATGATPGGTGGAGSVNPGAAGVPGGPGPGNTAVTPNQPAVPQSSPTVGNGPGGSFTNGRSRSGLSTSPGTLGNRGNGAPGSTTNPTGANPS